MKHVRSAMAIGVAFTLSSGLASETIEEVIVTSSFVGQKISDIDNPLHIVDGDDLSTDATSSLGESLDNLLGVASADFGAATGQPIIRGMSGTRIGVLHNGMLNRDVSFLGADHPNDIDLSDIAQIEIVRGPSSLLYANGTIGGIINVVDDTIAREDFAEHEFRFGVESQSVNDGEVGELSYRGNMGGFNLSLSFKDSNLDNFDIPRGAVIHSEEEHHDEDHDDHEGEHHDEDHDDHEGEHHDEDHDDHEGEHHDEDHDEHEGEEMATLANSDFEAQAKRIGISKTGDWGYVGMSFSNNESVYGIPYHGEGHEGHEGHGDEHEGERIFSVTDSDKFDIRGSFLLENGFVNRVDYSFRDSDYSLTEQHADGDGAHHSEEEHGDDHDDHDAHDEHDGEGPTTFKSESQEFGAVFDLSNNAFSQRFVVNYLDAENSIVGAESFMNPVFCKGMTFGYFLSREVGPFTMDVGIRHDRSERRGSLTHLNQHHDDHDDEEHHDDEGHDDDHDDHEGEEHEDDHGIHDEHEGLAETDFFKTDFNNTSYALSLGRQLNDSLDLKLGFASVERAPSDVELFMNGPHLATGRFEVGNVAMDSEKSNNIDLTLNYESGNFFAGLTFFKNDVDSYIYLQDEAEEEHEGHEDHGGLIRADYMQKDSEFEGYEIEVGTDIDLNTGTLSFLYGRDSVRGKFKDGTNIPRIVPARNMFSILYSGNDLKLKISLQDVEKQDDIAFNETSTSGHQMLDLKVTRSFQVGPKAEISVSLYGKNLLDEVARNHSSFVKDQVPLPGRNFGIRLSGKF